jgi:hypothetical protein
MLLQLLVMLAFTAWQGMIRAEYTAILIPSTDKIDESFLGLC